MKKNSFQIKLNIPISDAIYILNTNIGYDKLLSINSPKFDVIGTINKKNFSIHKKIYYRNSFKPFFYGVFIDESDKCSIIGEFKYNLFTRLFLKVWYFMCIIFCIIGIPIGIISYINDQNFDDLAFAYYPILFIVFALILEFIGYRAGNHENYLICFLNKIYSKYKINGV